MLFRSKERYELYKDALEKIDGLRLLECNKKATNNYSYFPIIINENYRYSRDQLYEFFKKQNIFCRKYFYPLISEQKCYSSKYRSNKLSNAQNIADNVLILPLYEDIEIEVIKEIIKIIIG